MNYAKSIDEYFVKQERWAGVLQLLRGLLQATELEETLKWGSPVYALDNKNVVGLAAFKSYVGIWFYQGALLADEDKVLVNAQEGKTKALRQWRFQSLQEINSEQVKKYISEAIENQKKGFEIKPQKKELRIPKQLQAAIDQNRELQTRFNQLSRGKQIEYAEYISEAKQNVTKSRRLEKIVPMIFEQKGLHDKYKRS